MPDMNEDQLKELYRHIDQQLREAAKALDAKMDTVLQNQLALSERLENISGNERTGTQGRIDRIEAKQNRLVVIVEKHEDKFDDYDRLRWKLSGYAIGIGTASGVGAATLSKILFG